MNAQISLIRILVGDNVAPFTYTDAQIKAAISITSTPASGPLALRLCANLGFRQFPVGG